MDSILIFPPGASVAGSQLQLGTYLMWDPGADYGAKGLIQSIESSNALRDGGVFAYRSVGPRQMSFPLLLRDVPGRPLLQTESLLREWTTAGARVAVQPETVPSGQAVFFDVLDGRWEPDYDGFYNRAGYRRGTLFLDTQPWGYWPTEMLLASAASIGFMGNLPVNGGSVLGDVPPLAHVSIAPTVASFYASGGGTALSGRWQPDMLALSLSARPSFSSFIAPAAFVGVSGGVDYTPTLIADKYAPASQAWSFVARGDSNPFGWYNLAFSSSAISSALEPAYRGRFRVFGFARLNVPAATAPWQLLVDAERFVGTGPNAAMASANQSATAYGAIPTTALISASPAYDILDLGELTLPPAGSGIQQGDRLRVWGRIPSVPAAATWSLSFGGLYLLPVDGAAGILTRGMISPSYSPGAGQTPTQAAVDFNANSVESVEIVAGFPASAPLPAPIINDARPFYRGAPLRVGASTSQLLILTGDRLLNLQGADPNSLCVQANVEYSQVSVSYRPTFQFLAGL